MKIESVSAYKGIASFFTCYRPVRNFKCLSKCTSHTTIKSQVGRKRSVGPVLQAVYAHGLGMSLLPSAILNYLFVCIACVSSRPGQSGRCDGYILDGKELEFYIRKIRAKKAK